MTIPASISHGVQQLQEWLKELRDNGDLEDEHMAYGILRAVLHELRDRLTLDEAVDLGAQLPLIVRGTYYEGWRPRDLPHKIRSKQKFLDEVEARMRPARVASERVVRDVFALLAHHCDPGEISDVIEQLPDDIKELWPQTAQTFRKRTR